MSLFSFAFNQTAYLHRYSEISKTGDIVYDPQPLPFSCRFEYKRREVLDKDGNKVISEVRLFTEQEMKPLDMVVFGDKTWTVKSVAPQSGLTGDTDHWEVTL